MPVTDRDAWTCGLVYLAVVLTGIVSLGWIPGVLDPGSDPAHIQRAISAQAQLYRAGVAAWILNQLAFLALGLAFYRVLRPFGPEVAAVMAVLVTVSVPSATQASFTG